MTPYTRALLLDAACYALFTVFALTSAVWSEFSGYRLWGVVAAIGYLLALVQAGWLLTAKERAPRLLRSPVGTVTVVGLLGLLVPLVVLLFRRRAGIAWSEQPEVWVVERSASLLLAHGTPYTNLATLGRAPVVDDYTPYGPAMTLFGLPRALLGDSVLTDARVVFGVVSVALVLRALALLRWPRVPARTVLWVMACPLTALTFAVAGDDLPVVALLVLALALLYRGRDTSAGFALALAISMKLTALPALVVFAAAVLAARGQVALGRFLLSALGLTALLTVPVLLVDPHSFVEHVIRFPLGLAHVSSPAASPLPGHLIAALGPIGHAAAIALMVGAALGMFYWLLRRPPLTAAQVAVRTAVGLGAATLLAPATRYGYLVYPAVLIGAAILLHAMHRDAPAPAPPEPARAHEDAP